MTDKLIYIRLAPEWVTFPVWTKKTNSVEIDCLPPEALVEERGASPEVAARIEAWDAEFQDKYVHEDPRLSGFATAKEEQDWYARGRKIAKDLSVEFGDEVTVEIRTPYGSETIHKRPADSDETS